MISFSLCPTISFAVDSTEIVFGNVSSENNSEVVVPVSIKNNPGIAAFRFRISYDTENLTFISADKGTVLVSGTLSSSINNNTKEVTFLWYSTKDVNGDGDLVLLHFMTATGSEGNFKITVSYLKNDILNSSGNVLNCNVTEGNVRAYTPVHVTNIALNKNEATLKIGSGEQLSTSILPTNATNTRVFWTSSDSNVVTVDDDGIITAAKAGIAVITASAADNGLSSKCTVSVFCEHDWSKSEIIKEPTCTADGTKKYSCSICGNTYTESVPAKEHSFTVLITPPNCTQGGYSTYTCNDCGYYYVSDSTPKTEHEYVGSIIIKPSCVSAGLKSYTCSNCGKNYTDTVPATVHSFGDWTVISPATTVREGTEQRICSACGTKENRSIPKLTAEETTQPTTAPITQPATEPTFVYTLGDINDDGKISATDARLVLRFSADLDNPTDKQAIAADVTDDGKVSASDARLILRCAAEIENFTVICNHQYVLSNSKAADCTNEGFVKYICSVCGKELKNVTPALGHDLSVGSCTKDSVCSRCDFLVTAPGHKFSEKGTVIQKETCEQEGIIEYKCTVCGEVKKDSVPKLEHTYKAATCTTPQICSMCGATQGSPLGHNFVDNECSRCGLKISLEDFAVGYVKYSLMSNLKNPKSLIINQMGYCYSTDRIYFYLDYSAMNGFGGYNRESIFGFATFSGKYGNTSPLDVMRYKYILMDTKNISSKLGL